MAGCSTSWASPTRGHAAAPFSWRWTRHCSRCKRFWNSSTPRAFVGRVTRREGPHGRLALLEQPLLAWSLQCDGRCGIGIVNFRIVEFSADGIPAHHVRVVRLENVPNRFEFGNVGIEPEVALIRRLPHTCWGQVVDYHGIRPLLLPD